MMRGIQSLLSVSLILLVGVLIATQIVSSSDLPSVPQGGNIKYGTNWVSTTEGNQTTMRIYSGQEYIIEDNQWKHISEARSLKGSSLSPIFTEKDFNYGVRIIDYNLTSITVSLGTTPWNYFRDIPVRVWKPDTEKDPEALTGNYKEDFNKVREETVSLFLRKKKTYNFERGDILEFGPHSTTLVLGDAENLGDSWIDKDRPTKEYGTSVYLRVVGVPIYYGDDDANALIKFNISQIPEQSTITEANLSLRLISEELGPSQFQNVTAIETDTNWEESTVNWNNQPSNIGSDIDSLLLSGSPDRDFYNWTITSIVESNYLDNDDIISIRLYDNLDTLSKNRYVQFVSQEHVTSSYHPYLTIIYDSLIDNDAPRITINSPTNTTYTSSTINFTFTSTESVYCNYTLNAGSGNSTMSNITNILWNATNTTIADGNHQVYAYCDDLANNTNYTVSAFFDVDTTPPAVVTSLTNTTIGNYNVTLDWTNPSDDDFSKVLILRDYVNIANATGTTYYDSGLTSATTYVYTLHTIDVNNWTNNTDVNHSITTTEVVDSEAPGVTISSPTNTTYTTSSVTFTIATNEPAFCNYTLNAGSENFTMSNTSATSFTNTNSSMLDGAWQTYAYCNDYANNTNYTESVHFFVNTTDTSAPTITLVDPSDQATTVQRNSSYVNITISPADENVQNCTLEWDGTNESMTGSGLYWYKNKTNLAEQRYDYTVYCNNTDGFGAIATSYVVIDAVDATPSVLLNVPINGHTFTVGDVEFKYTPNDDRGFTNCSLFGNWTTDIFEIKSTDTSIENTSVNQFNIYSLDSGTYEWNVECVDNGGNAVTNETNRTFTIDLPVKNYWKFLNPTTLAAMFFIEKSTGEWESAGSGLVRGNLTVGDTLIAERTAFGDVFVAGESETEFVVGKYYRIVEEPTNSPNMTVTGTFAGENDTTYLIVISTDSGTSVGTATFNYSNDGTTNWTSTNIVTDDAKILLDQGVYISWSNNKTFSDGDVYSFDVIADTTRAFHIDTSRAYDIGKIFVGGEIEFNNTITINSRGGQQADLVLNNATIGDSDSDAYIRFKQGSIQMVLG